jgi:hypothetical protein
MTSINVCNTEVELTMDWENFRNVDWQQAMPNNLQSAVNPGMSVVKVLLPHTIQQTPVFNDFHQCMQHRGGINNGLGKFSQC